MENKKVFIGADHGGFELKQALVSFLKEKGYQVEDKGTDSLESCDYPDYIFPVGEGVVGNPGSVGVVICKSGIGASMVANKVKGVRAALVQTKEQALMSRRHNNANVLAFGSNNVSPELAVEILEAWLNEPFEGDRHERRLNKIKDYESNH